MKSFKKFRQDLPIVYGSIGNRKDVLEFKKEVPAIFASIGHYKDIKNDGVPIAFGSIGKRKDISEDYNPPGARAGERHNDFYKEGMPLKIHSSGSYDGPNGEVGYVLQDHLRNNAPKMLTQYYSEDHPDYKTIHDAYIPETTQKYRQQFSKKHPYIKLYTGSSADVNRHLIYSHKEGKDPMQEKVHTKTLQKLDESLDELSKPAPHDFHVYTGVGTGFNIAHIRAKQGDKVHLPAYTSTSINPSIAASFSNDGHLKMFGEMIRVHIPKGSTHGTYLGHLGEVGDEGEFLLKRGKTLKFHGEPRAVRTSGKTVIVHDATIHEEDQKNG